MKRFISQRFYLSLFLLGFLINYDATAQGDSTKTIHFENGYKEVHYGIPFLYLKGTDYEAGLQYGTLLKSELFSLHEEFEKFKEQMMANEIQCLPWYQRIFANMFGGMVWRHKINSYADRLSANIEDQIRGAAEGSGLPESFFREIQVIVDLYSNRCEGIVIKKGGRMVHCHNLDQPMPVSLISKYPVVVNYDIQGKQQYTDIGFFGLFTPTTAFNESGISVSENGNNNPSGFDRANCTLYSDKIKFMTETHNLREADSIANILKFPRGMIFIISSSKEKQATVYDFIGSMKGETPVGNYQFVANRTVSKELGKKSETYYSGQFHDTCREIKFDELIDTAKPNMVDEAISILSNTDFYHYTDGMPVYLESLNNYETDQSVIFDLADSTVYFTCYAHFAAWNRWLKYNYVNHQVSVYKEADPKLNDPFLAQLNDLYGKTEACDWRDSTNVRSLTTSIINSKIENFYCLDFLSRTFRDYYKLPSESMIYTDKMIKKYPDIITGYYNKGRALEAENKLEEAIAEYFHALDCKIQCEYFVAETDEHLALAHSSLGKKDIAAEYATRALAIHNQYWIPEHLKKRIQKLEKIKDKSD
jgi:hypothetical protein